MHQRFLIENNNKGIMYISDTKIEKGITTSYHSHPNLELLLVTEGSGSLNTSLNQYNIKKNNLIIINGNSTHVENGEGLSFYALGINNIDVFLNETFNEKIIVSNLNQKEYNTLLAIYQMIYQNATLKDSYSLNIITSCYEIILNTLRRKFIIIENEKEEPDIIANIKNIIDNYYVNNFKLADIAKRLNMSVSSICHIFKEYEGKSIVDYKINKQLEEAKSLLEISDMNVSEITNFVGFNNSSYFISCFKKKYGITPNGFRKKILKDK